MLLITRVGLFMMCASLMACAGQATSQAKLVLLTREGCVNTEVMRANLDEALAALLPSPTYEVVDLDAVPESDGRRGYPTPTLLYANRDVFGLAEPRPPFPEPT